MLGVTDQFGHAFAEGADVQISGAQELVGGEVHLELQVEVLHHHVRQVGGGARIDNDRHDRVQRSLPIFLRHDTKVIKMCRFHNGIISVSFSVRYNYYTIVYCIRNSLFPRLCGDSPAVYPTGGPGRTANSAAPTAGPRARHT